MDFAITASEMLRLSKISVENTITDKTKGLFNAIGEMMTEKAKYGENFITIDVLNDFSGSIGIKGINHAARILDLVIVMFESMGYKIHRSDSASNKFLITISWAK